MVGVSCLSAAVGRGRGCAGVNGDQGSVAVSVGWGSAAVNNCKGSAFVKKEYNTIYRVNERVNISISPEVCVKDVLGLITGDMSEVASDLETGE